MTVDAKDCLRDLAIIEQRIVSEARLGVDKVAKVAWRTAHDTTLFNDVTGELRGTIDIEDKGDYGRRLIWRATYARYLTEGTKAHGPRTASVMRFQIGGRWISTKWVKGITPRPFDVHAALAGALEMTIVMNEGAERAVNYP